VNVKAQGLLNAASWVRETHGPEAFDRVLASCSPAVRERCAAATTANQWMPMAELVELFAAIDRQLGAGDGKLVEAIGATSARVNLRHLGLRLAFFVARPEFLMRRVAGVWRQYNDEGEMRVLSFNDGEMHSELRGLLAPDWFFCCSITGWLHEAGVATGMKELVARHAYCRAKGEPRCLWELHWNPKG
jgi:hypothetical protein